MGKKFDFVILGAHGSGLNAINSFLNLTANIKCMFSQITTKTIENFFQNSEVDSTLGIIVDTKEIINDPVINYLLSHLSSDVILIVLLREPIERIKSVMNTHLQWWADAVSGAHEVSLSQTMLYNWGDESSLLCELLSEDCVNPVPTMYEKFSQSFENKIFFDISALYPENIIKTLNKLSSYFPFSHLNELLIPQSLPFSRKNLFVRYVKKLYLDIKLPDKNFSISLQPCPQEFCSLYGFTDERILLTIKQNEYNFTLGDFSGDISFVICNPAKFDLNDIKNIKNYIRNNPLIIENYIADLTKRHNFSKLILKSLLLTDTKLMNFAKHNTHQALLLYNYCNTQYQFMKNEAPDFIKKWSNTLHFIKELENILRTN